LFEWYWDGVRGTHPATDICFVLATWYIPFYPRNGAGRSHSTCINIAPKREGD
jgi:hypothetical protein